VPESWATSQGLHNILSRESGGVVGRPNYTYGRRANDRSQWGAIHDELRNGQKTARSSATGLGQLLLSNVDRYYPNGRAGIGDPVQEAAGMLRYIQDRYGHPDVAWQRYNTRHEGY
jgi:SLT domain-containing protein